MSNTTNNNQRDNNNGGKPRYAYDPISYNTAGLLPTSTTFNVPVKDFRKFVKDFSGSIIGANTIESVTVDHNTRTGLIDLYVWIRSDSSHLKDTPDENAMIKKDIRRLSNTLKDFLNKYGFNPEKDYGNRGMKINQKDLLVTNKSADWNGPKVTGLRLSWTSFIDIMFDGSGKAYADVNKTKAQSTKVMPTPIFAGKEGRFTELLFIEVVKSTKQVVRKTEPVASFRS